MKFGVTLLTLRLALVFYDQFPSSFAFDGNMNTIFYATGQGSSITWDASSFGLSGTIRVRPSGNSNSDLFTASADGVGFTMRNDSPWSEPLTVASLNTLVVSGKDRLSDGAITAIEVNGELLIDTGVGDLGDTHVEYQTNGGQGSIIEVNTTDNTLLVTNSGDGDNRWIAGKLR